MEAFCGIFQPQTWLLDVCKTSMSCRSKIMLELEALAEQGAFRKGLKPPKSSKTSEWANPILRELRHPSVIPNVTSLRVPGAGGLGTSPALPKWGYFLFRAGELPWDWLIDPDGNDSCPGLLTMTFNPVEKSIPPVLLYLLFVKHSWLGVPVQIGLAACHFCVQGQINPCIQQWGASWKSTFFHLFLQEKNTGNLWPGMQQVLQPLELLFSIFTAPFYCKSFYLPVVSFKKQVKFRCKIQMLHQQQKNKQKKRIWTSFFISLASASCPCSLSLWCKFVLRTFCHLKRTKLFYKTLRLLGEFEPGLF